METFFGVPTERIALSALGLLGLVLTVLGLRAARWPIFMRLGVRQLPRRPVQTALIVVGLTLSTALVAASLATGDTITHALRSAAVAELGPLDELITYIDMPRLGSTPAPGGGNPFAPNSFFPYAAYQRLEDQLGASQDVADLLPALRFTCTMINVTSRQTSFATLSALPPGHERTFGALRRSDGGMLDLGALSAGQAYVNETGGAALAVKPEDELACTVAGVPLRLTAMAVAAKGGLDASAAVNVFVSLEWLQQALQASGRGADVERPINLILVANRGTVLSSAQRTDAVVKSIRALLLDPASIAEIRTALRRDDLRAALGVRQGTFSARTQVLLKEALDATDAPLTTETAVRLDGALLSDAPRNALLAASRDVPDAKLAAELDSAFRRAFGFRVQPVKQQILLFADRAGNVITSIFLLFSLLSIAAAILLVFLIFSLLAASRRSELGITRALGTERGHLVAMFTYEGVAYAVLAAIVGIPTGLAISRGMVGLLVWAVESGVAGFTGAPQRIAETVRWHAEPRSVALAAVLGLLLTTLTVAVAAWRVSRLNIVSAIRDLPEPPAERRSITSFWWLALLVTGVALVALGLWLGETFPFAGGISAWALAAGGALRHLGRTRLGRDAAGRAGATTAGVGLTAYWALPFDAQQRLGLPRLSSGIEIFALGGVLMIAGLVWAFVANGDWFARGIGWTLTRLRWSAPALRLAAAHTLRQPARTGLTMAMFGLVVFMLTVMQVVTAAAIRFQADPQTVYGGWQIEGQTRAGSRAFEGVTQVPAGEVRESEVPNGGPFRTGNTDAENVADPTNADSSAPPSSAPLPSPGPSSADTLPALALGRADLAPFIEAAGLRKSAFFALLQLTGPAPAWGGYQVVGVDRSFAAGNRVPLQARARGFATDREVWEAVAAGTGLAVLDANALPSPQIRNPPAINGTTFTLHGLLDETRSFEPAAVWIGNPTGTAARVEVIGLIDRRASTSFRGLHVSLAQMDALGPPIRPASHRLYFRVPDGIDVDAARAALGDTFFENGLETENLNNRFVNQSGPFLLASRMLQLFVALGLFVGIAALAVISTRAALERRQLIGILRAIGLERGVIASALLLESAMVVFLGSGLGLALGLVLCRNVFAVQFFDRFQQGLTMTIPWDQLLLTLFVTCSAALLATWLPARQASRVPPIAALREG